ncbi:hypothetical protein OG568_45335 [Streptomyces sp. NBC_01450]|uniref:2-dehydropantoate 2-reductase N-terminal domain-containing protein n=1 Tax=Streptomyces sp. NBC_01450 TaxID=2903871 RepID=UPI002E2F7446|nr:2-dehydropantoate 2-reductase N-terminal domain-containing protein [Streptomyces sp. NBC_01450]
MATPCEELAAPYDVVLLAVKATGLERAVDDMAAAVGPHSLVVPLLNGVRHVDVLAARFGDQAVPGGVSKVATTLDAQGDIVRLAPCRDRAHLRRPGPARPPARAHRSAARSGRHVSAPAPEPHRGCPSHLSRALPSRCALLSNPRGRSGTPAAAHPEVEGETGRRQRECTRVVGDRIQDRRVLGRRHGRPWRRTVATTAAPGHFPRSPTAPYHTGPGLSRSG